MDTFKLKLSGHKLLSLAIDCYWKNELNNRFEWAEFNRVVNEGSITEFVDFACHKASSNAIQLILTLINDVDNSGNKNIDDFPDSNWLSIQNQLKSDLSSRGHMKQF